MTTACGTRTYGFAFPTLLIATVFACASSGSDSTDDPGRASDPNATQGPPTTDRGTPSSTDGGGGDGPTLSTDAGMVDDASPLKNCASSATKGDPVPLDIYIMLDQSGSMNDLAGGNTKWGAVTSAIQAYVTPPQQNVSVGLQFFGLQVGPNSTPACVNGASCQTDVDCAYATCQQDGTCKCDPTQNDSCTAADYAVPAVEIAPLPGVANAITTLMMMQYPQTGTPTAPALQGAIQHASTWASAHPKDVTVVVFATDGMPSECAPQDIPSIAQIAAAGANGTPKILTFVIGVGSATGNLNAIAQGGGTGSAFTVDTNANAQQQFLDALNKIRGTVLGCKYTIPVPASGTPDFGSVNVQFTPTSGTSRIIPKVKDASACPSSGDAWYYDDNTNPTHIVLCKTTCDTLSSSAGEVDVVLGCATVLN